MTYLIRQTLSLLFVISQFNSIEQHSYTFDYCNINESKTAYFIIKDLIEYFELDKTFTLSNSKCLLIDTQLTNYFERFGMLEISNKSSYGTVKCPECEKKFKSRYFLNLHYKMFHLSQNKNYVDKYFCPGDFCRALNCERYKVYLNIPLPDNTRDGYIYNRQPREKYQVCNEEMIGFYKSLCMRMIYDCFSMKDTEKYFAYYKHFCHKISCIKEGDPMKVKMRAELSRDGSMWDAMRLIGLYITSIGIFIYILIVWVSKYS